MLLNWDELLMANLGRFHFNLLGLTMFVIENLVLLFNHNYAIIITTSVAITLLSALVAFHGTMYHVSINIR